MKEAAGGQNRTRRENIGWVQPIIAEPTTGEIDGQGTPIEQLDERCGTRGAGPGHQLVQHHLTARAGVGKLPGTRRSARSRAGGPGSGIGFAVTGPHQGQ